jgi:hypothetical protein
MLCDCVATEVKYTCTTYVPSSVVKRVVPESRLVNRANRSVLNFNTVSDFGTKISYKNTQTDGIMATLLWSVSVRV